jgi:hypothetical protein
MPRSYEIHQDMIVRWMGLKILTPEINVLQSLIDKLNLMSKQNDWKELF